MTTRALSLICVFAAAAAHGQVLPPEFDSSQLVWRVHAYEGSGGRVPFVRAPVLEELAKNPGYFPDWPGTVTAGEGGSVSHQLINNGWAATEIEARADGAALLTGAGFSTAFVNGQPFGGDFYSAGILRLAVPLHKGRNTVLVRSVRGGFTFNLSPLEGDCSTAATDALVPDLREGEMVVSPGAVIVLNHTGGVLRGARLEVGDGAVIEKVSVELQPIVPYGLVKTPFPVRQLREAQGDSYDLPLVLTHGNTRQELTLSLPVRKPGEVCRVTRLSDIDGSVQYYAVRPPLEFRADREYALYLSLHGAGVEATGQAGAHYSKYDAYTVAATNRRPYGFDWQEWGRIDALETLRDFASRARIDPGRVYLVGHSMGGHGVWYMGATYPGLWAAIGPSAGWVSFFSYGGLPGPQETSGVTEPLERAKRESDTLGLLRNLAALPIYAVHGEKDDNVPISEMNRMLEQLRPLHQDLHSHVEPGAGHWYDAGPYPGADCLDYPPRNELFAARERPKLPLRLSFRTQNPAVSAEHFWLTVLQQERSGFVSSVDAELDPAKPELTVTTDNVAALRFDLSRFFAGRPDLTVTVDGQKVAATGPVCSVARREGVWTAGSPDPRAKSPDRAGPFKLAFDRRMVWVYGTHGTPEENAAVLAKARLDQQVWWYRGNGNALLLPDTDFEPARFAGRNVILYGHADMNTAFDKVLTDCPIRVRRGGVTVGNKRFDGDLGAYFLYPRAGTRSNSVGVVGATSALAIRRAYDPRYFTAGVSLPDYVVFGPETLLKGDGGVLAAGYFDSGWDFEEK